MAPLYPEIIKTKLPYKGGYQAIQMAGNAQADNYDAQYRLSSSTCLSNQDVMVGFAVNHAYFNNSLYNSINIVDISKAYGFNAATLNNKNDYTYYVVLTSRNMQEMNRVSNIIKNTLQSNFKKIQIKIFEIYIPTEPTITDGIPMCHKISMVERVYINTRYISVTNKDLCYSVEDLFGKHFDMLNDEIKITEDAWESLINVVGPSIQQYIPPIYFKTTYYPYFLRNWIIIVICFLSIILFFCTIHIIFFKKKEIKKNK
jgi:hypothetical protein